MFSQTTEYALRAMSWLALSPESLVPTGELAARTKVPEHYLAKVLQQLAAAKLIKGRRGVGGGYRLARPAGEIPVSAVVRAVTRMERITECPLGIPGHGALCAVHRLVDDVMRLMMERLDDHTLHDLISQPGASTPLCDTRRTDGACGSAAGTAVPLSVDGRAR